MRLRCPGCRSAVELQGDLIERHHAPNWETVGTFELREDCGVPLVIERRLECGYSGARVRVKT